MQSTALRMAARSVASKRGVVAAKRSLATAAATHAEASATSASPARNVAPVPLSNIEAHWARLSEQEQAAVHEQLEVVQQKDWKELSLDEKKAAYYVAFGPHGPRAPTSNPGDTAKIILAVSALVGVSTTLFFGLRGFSQPPPKTITKEWEEAMTERAKELNLDPITGIPSEGYKGKGFVQQK